MKNLRQFYKELKDSHERSGFNRDKWPYYDLIDAVLGDRPATRPPVVIDATLQSPGSQLEEEADESQQNTSNISSVNSQTPSTDPDMEEETNLSDDTVEQPVVQAAGQHQDATSRGLPTNRKRAKKSGLEKTLSSLTETFLTHQRDIEERMLKVEERRQKLEMEQMGRMRKADREHELRLFQMLGQMMGSGPPPPPPHYYVPPMQHPSTMGMPPPLPPDHTDTDIRSYQ